MVHGYSCNWKNAIKNFKAHASSEAHLEAYEKLALVSGNVSILKSLDQGTNREQHEATVALKAICSTLLALAQTGCAIRGHSDDEHGNLKTWLKLRSEDIPDLQRFLLRKKSYVSHDVQNELLLLMSNNVLRQLLEKVKKSPFYSLIVDETTDTSTKEQVSICLRYLSCDFEPFEAFIGLYEVSDTTGENLTNVIQDSLLRCGLTLEKLRGQCYDGARNMSGEFKGVQNRIKQDQPAALYVHCCAHSLNLALQEAAFEVEMVRDSMDYLQRAAVLLGRSAKRKAILHNVPATIKTLCPTRWAVRAESVSTAIDNYHGILEALEIVATNSKDDKGAEAHGLLEQFRKGKMYWSLLVARKVFDPADNLARVLQGEKMTVNGSLEAVRVTRNFLETMRTDECFCELMNMTDQAVHDHNLDHLAAPRMRKIPRRIDDGSVPGQLSMEEYFRQHFFKV